MSLKAQCDELVGFMESGSSRPFKARSQDGSVWVVKAHGNPQGNKALFNELVAGRLAALISLPWPEVGVVELTEELTQGVRNFGLSVTSRWAVGTRFMQGLAAVGFPDGGFTWDADFRTRNWQHVSKLISHDLRRTAALHGKLVFDNWVLLEDTKYDTLHIKENGDPFFLDASYAFGGDKWNDADVVWKKVEIDRRSPYLEGLPVRLVDVEPWLARIRVASRAIASVLSEVPDEWGAPRSYICRVAELLESSEAQFLPLFIEWVEEAGGNHA
jgi:hypothetical protein